MTLFSETALLDDLSDESELGMCNLCRGVGPIRNLCVNCKDTGMIYDSISTSTHKREEKINNMSIKGIGLCHNCYSIGPYKMQCKKCAEKGKEYNFDGWNIEPGEGLCPACCCTGPLGYFCIDCAKWFYEKPNGVTE